MGSRYKFSTDRIVNTFQEHIFPQFTQNLPDEVAKVHRGVPMELCLNTLLLTSLTNSSFQEVYDDYHREIEYQEVFGQTPFKRLPKAHYIRKTLIAWEPQEIIKRHRKILKDQLRQLRQGDFWKQTHTEEGVILAFDITERGYFGPEDEYTVYSKGRTVAKRCHAYLSLQIMCPGQRLMLDFQPVYTNNKPIGKLMARMLSRVRKQGLKIKRIY